MMVEPGYVVIVIVTIAVGIPMIAVTLGSFAAQRTKLKEKQLDLAASLAADKVVAQAAQIERLEQRMRVLERIATDKGADLAAQIEDLRDEKIN